MTEDRLRRILRGPRACPDCGGTSFLGETHCPDCGARIVNRNPLLRFLFTAASLGVIFAVVWWKLKT